MTFDTGIPNIRVIIREASDENLTVDVPNISVKLEQGSQYNVNITPNAVTTLRTGSFNTYADLAGNAVTASYAIVAQTLIGSVQSASFASTASNVLGGTKQYIPLWSTNTTLSSSRIFQTQSSILIGATEQHTPDAPDTLGVFAQSGSTSYNLISAHGNTNSYLQLNLKNFSAGTSASSDIVATADVGTETSGYVNMGINSSNYTNTGDGIGTALDAYLYTQGAGDLLIGNKSPDKKVVIFTGEGDAIQNARVLVDPSGSVGINSSQFDSTNPEALLVQAINDQSYNLIRGTAAVDNYIQLNIQNISTGYTASSDVVATADNGTETSNYIDMGINNSQYSVPNAVGGPNDAYLYSTGNHLHIGNASAGQDLMLFVGGLDVEAATKLTLRDNNQHILSGSLTITEGATGSLYGTASWALNAVTASYVSGSSGTVGPGTSQSIALFNSQNTISSSIIFQSGSNIGIGINNPRATLHIEGGSANWNESVPGGTRGTIHLDPGVTTDDFGNAITFGASDFGDGESSQAGIYVRTDGAYGAKMYFATSNNYGVGATTRMYIGHDGRVGIGTTSPTSLLHVSGANNTTPVRVSIGNNATYNFSGNSTSGYITTFNMDDTGSSFGHNSSARDLQLRTNSTARLTILGGGNVGIGTTNPENILHISKDGGASTVRLLRIDNSNVTYAQNVYLDMNTNKDVLWSQGSANGGTFWDAGTRGYGFSINTTRIVTFDQIGNISASGYTSSRNNAVGFLGTASWAQSSSIAAAANSVTFTSFSNASYYFPQNVRVEGTLTAQQFNIEIISSSIIYESGSTKFGDSLDDTHQFTGSLQVLGSLTGSLLGTSSWAQNAVTASYISGSSTVGPGTSASIALFNTSTGVSSSTIFQSGNNIGIGTNSPAYRLQVGVVGTGVQSGIYVPAQFNWDGAYLQQATSGGRGAALTLAAHVNGVSSSAYRISADNDSASRTLVFSYASDAGAYASASFTELMRLDRFGNVGIGTPTPSAKLQVSGSAVIDGTLNVFDSGSNNFPLSVGFNNRATSQYIRVNSTASTERGLAFSTAGNLRWITYANSSTESTGDAGSNFAISAYNDAGTVIDTPFSIVRAASGVISLNRNIRTLTGSVGTPVISPTVDTNTGIYFPAPDNIGFVEGGTEAMRIDSSANVGIGITSPTAKLDIGGAIDGNVQAVFTRGNDGLFQLQAVNASAANTTGALVSKFGLRYSGSGDAAVFKFYRGGGAQDASVAIEVNGGTEALRAVASGRVGIGTSTPSTTLQVSGSQVVDGGLTVLESGSSVWPITAGYSTRPASTYIRVNASASTFRGFEMQTAGTRRWLLYTDNAAETGANVGSTFNIGAYNDAGSFIDAPITIERKSNGLIYFTRTLRAITGSNASPTIAPTDGYGITFPNTTNIGFVINSSEVMRIDSSANVGIGTTSAGAKLHVQGNVSASSYTSSINNAVGFFGTSSWAASASVASGFSGTANRVLYNNASNVTTTSANLTFDGTNLTVGGQLNAATKSFLINHKTKPGKKLVYGVIEGPEHSVFVRGRLTGKNTIVLPNEWEWLVDLDSITVQLTAIGKPQKLFVKSIDRLYITVENGGFFSGPIDCYYLIQATRKDVEPLQTVV